MFFENTQPLARTADPQTSHEAAAQITHSGARTSQKTRLLEFLLAGCVPLTAHEISRAGNFEHAMVHKRLPDLAHDGRVRKLPARVCRVTGTAALTWQAIPAAEL